MTEEKEQDKRHTYDSWRIVTEADFVTLFIKTWFSFVSTLRELYPDRAKPYYEATGDAPYLSQYREEFSENFYFLLKYSKIEADLIHTYRRGLRMTGAHYPRFLLKDFYKFNSSFKESYVEAYGAAGGYSGTLRLVIRLAKDNMAKAELICTDKQFLSKTKEKHIITSTSIAVDDIIELIVQNLEEKPREISETGMLITFYQFFFRLVSADLTSALEEKKNALPDKGNKQVKQVYSLMQSFCMRGSEALKAQCLNPDISDEHKLLIQLPTYEYTQSFGNLSAAEEQRAYLWFISFAYRLRNALFHEIIDPLDVSWQIIFKSAYLVLKHVVEANVGRLKMCETLKELAPKVVESDFRESPPPQIPINESFQTTFKTEKIEIAQYTKDGAKVKVEMTVICDGISYRVQCTVKREEGKEAVVKHVQITQQEESPSDRESEQG